jgi:hypothetical protein
MSIQSLWNSSQCGTICPQHGLFQIVGIGQNLAYNHAIDSQSFPNGHCLVLDKLWKTHNAMRNLKGQ